jgi:hypothetical protein
VGKRSELFGHDIREHVSFIILLHSATQVKMAENSSTDAEGSSHSDKTVDCVDVRPNSTINYIQ